MGDWRSLHDELDGDVHQYFKYDEGENRVILRTYQDVEPIADEVHALHTAGNNGYNADKSLQHQARIPYNIWLLWESVYGVNLMQKENKELLNRLINERDYRKFKVIGGNAG